jgi:hypothetical protein
MVGNSTAPIVSFINHHLPSSINDWEIVGLASLVLVVLVVYSSSICRLGIMFVDSSIWLSSTICASSVGAFLPTIVL